MLRKSFILIATVFSSFFAYSQSQDLKINRLNEQMYVYTTFQEINGTIYAANGMYVLTDEGVILIDTPWDKTQFTPLVEYVKENHNKEINTVIVTHFHEDRAGGLAFFEALGAKTYAYELTNEILQSKNEPIAQETFGNEKDFNIAGEEFSVHFLGEGHTKDNVVIWFPNESVLYGGCLVKSAEATDLGFIGDANTQEWPATIAKVKNKFPFPDTIIPGHDDWNMWGHIENTERILRAYNKPKKNK